METTKNNKYLAVKRVLDFAFAVVALLLLWWVLLACAIAIKLAEPHAPIFYNAKRIGRNRVPFVMYKFRTMRPEFTGLNTVDESLSTVGKFLRTYSLDELPQLLNIIKGEMSFIGPRPMPPLYLDYFTLDENLRHDVRPGISGLAQVNGRVSILWDKRFAFDVDYVRHVSFALDRAILLRTASVVLGHKNAVVGESDDAAITFDEYRAKTLGIALPVTADVAYSSASAEFEPFFEPQMNAKNVLNR